MTQSDTPRRRLMAALALALLALATLAAPAAGRIAPPAFGAGSATSLIFSGRAAQVVGDTALVPVRCLGPRRGICSGTATLAFAGARHKAPFSVAGGRAGDIAVPIGRHADLGGRRAVAVARTAQTTGRLDRASAVIHFR
jgi:hypothetical protein